MFNLGQVDKWGDANSIQNPMIAISAKAIQLGANQGAFYQAMVPMSNAITTSEYDVYGRTLTSQSSLMGATAAADTDTVISVDSSYINTLTNGLVVQIEDEAMVVESVDRSANTFTPYSRGYGGTTAAAHAAGSVIEIIGDAVKDADADEVESFSESTVIYKNYVNTVLEAIQLTKSNNDFSRKGLEADKYLVTLVNEAMLRVAARLSKMAIRGYKSVGSTNGGPSSAAGLLQQLQDTVSGTRSVLVDDAGGAVISQTILDAAMKQVLLRGTPNAMFVSPSNKAVINGFNAVNTNIDVQANIRDTRAGVYVSTYIYDGYEVPIFTDSDMPDTSCAIVDLNKCEKGWKVDDQLNLVDENTNNSRELKKTIQGAVGFAIGDVGNSHILIKNLG